MQSDLRETSMETTFAAVAKREGRIEELTYVLDGLWQSGLD